MIGVPDPQSGERVCACVVLRPGAALSLADVRTFMQTRGVMLQKIPEQLELLDELPRNATGKVRKDQLRARCIDPEQEFHHGGDGDTAEELVNWLLSASPCLRR